MRARCARVAALLKVATSAKRNLLHWHTGALRADSKGKACFLRIEIVTPLGSTCVVCGNVPKDGVTAFVCSGCCKKKPTGCNVCGDQN